jgi:hypothetical protein
MFPKLFAPGKIGEPRKFFQAIEERTPTALRIV